MKTTKSEQAARKMLSVCYGELISTEQSLERETFFMMILWGFVKAWKESRATFQQELRRFKAFTTLAGRSILQQTPN